MKNKKSPISISEVLNSLDSPASNMLNDDTILFKELVKKDNDLIVVVGHRNQFDKYSVSEFWISPNRSDRKIFGKTIVEDLTLNEVISFSFKRYIAI
jgi:hypothetical protein